MIFVTVGTQFPFDRLILALDKWAENNPDIKVVAQIGTTSFKPVNLEYYDFLSPEYYKEVFDKSALIVSHAGMGGIISSLISSKPIIIFPRDSTLGEHRNQHQYSTCEKFEGMEGCYIAKDNLSLLNLLDNWMGLSKGKINAKNIVFCENLYNATLKELS